VEAIDASREALTDAFACHSRPELTRRARLRLEGAGATPAYVMAQMGHTDASLALEVYSKVMERKRDTGERLDALVRGADWTPMGTTAVEGAEPVLAAVTEEPPLAAAS
jgi:hypothetical protein